MLDFNPHALPPDVYHDIGGPVGEHIVLKAHFPACLLYTSPDDFFCSFLVHSVTIFQSAGIAAGFICFAFFL